LDTIYGMQTLLGLDGTNLLHRSFYALESTQMTDKDGRAIWAVHGLVNLIAKYIDELQPSSLMVAFDLPGGCPSRKALAPSYKQGRSAPAPELVDQLALVHVILEAAGVACGSVPDWEADDVLATLAQMAIDNQARAVVVSSDKDAHQLVGPTCAVYKPEGKLVTDVELQAKYAVTGSRWVEYAALLGEGADNLTGVLGVGPKRAAALIGAFGDIEDAISDPVATAGVVGAKVRDQLLAGVETFRRNRQVGTLRRDLVLDVSGVKLRDLDTERIRATMEEIGLRAAGSKLAGAVSRAQRRL